MIRVLALALALLAAGPASAFERLGIIAVADPPSGPDADLAELTHQIRAACRDRIGGVEDVPTMRARLLGQSSNATLSELDRAYGGALAVFQNGEFESALRTLHAIVEDLESLPETEDSYSQWVRAQLRLAHVALTIGRDGEADAALYALAKTDPGIVPDPEQYSPSYRRRFESIKGRVRALPARRLTVTAEGAPGTVFVNGRAVGNTPVALWLPAGTYRIGGQSADLRVPSFSLDLRAEDRSAVLDFALAESLRVNAGPGLALPLARRGDGIVRAGAWLVVDKVIAVSRVYEGEASFLLGSIYDVRRGALLREGSVRMVAGSVPAANLGALAAFLLTGQASRDVKDRTEPGRAASPPVATAQPPAPATSASAAVPPPVPAPPPAVAAPAAAPPALASGAPAAAPQPSSPPPPQPQAAPPAAATASSPAPPPIPPVVESKIASGQPPPNAAQPAAPETPERSKPARKTTASATKPPPAPAANAPAGPAAKAGDTSARARASTPGGVPGRKGDPASVAAARKPDASAGASARPPEQPADGTARRTPDLPSSTTAAAAAAPASPPPERPSPSLAVAPPSLPGGPRTAEQTAEAPRRWMRPAAIGSGVLAGALTALAVQQALASRGAYSDADAMVGPGGSLLAGSDPARYRALRSDGDAARRNAYVSAGAAVAFAAAAGVLGWKSVDRRPAPALAFVF